MLQQTYMHSEMKNVKTNINFIQECTEVQRLNYKGHHYLCIHYLKWKVHTKCKQHQVNKKSWQELCSVLQVSKNCITPNPKVKCIIQKEYRMSNWVNEYGSLSGLTYCWLWNSTSTLIQAAKLVQWLASKGNTQAWLQKVNSSEKYVYTIKQRLGTIKHYSK